MSTTERWALRVGTLFKNFNQWHLTIFWRKKSDCFFRHRSSMDNFRKPHVHAVHFSSWPVVLPCQALHYLQCATRSKLGPGWGTLMVAKCLYQFVLMWNFEPISRWHFCVLRWFVCLCVCVSISPIRYCSLWDFSPSRRCHWAVPSVSLDRFPESWQ